MAKKPIGSLSAAMLDTEPAASAAAVSLVSVTSRPVTVTVKLDDALYLRLKTFGAGRRRTNQDVLVAALVEYLDKHG